MNKLGRQTLTSMASAAALALIIQMPAYAEINDGIGHKIGQSANTPAMGANHPPVTNNHQMMGKGVMPANMPKMPEGPTHQGKVLEVISGAGYSYLRVEAGGQQFWIAGTQISTKVGDVVSYIENVTMSNFTSKTLNKTFDKIVFASTVSVVN